MNEPTQTLYQNGNVIPKKQLSQAGFLTTETEAMIKNSYQQQMDELLSRERELLEIIKQKDEALMSAAKYVSHFASEIHMEMLHKATLLKPSWSEK